MSLNKNQQKQFNMVCERIAAGASLVDVTKAKDVPSRDTINRWLAGDEDGGLQATYARAREAQAEVHAAETLAIADDLSIPVHDRRLMVDTRKWIASKLKPKQWGDKSTPGQDSDNPVHTVIRWVGVKPGDAD